MKLQKKCREAGENLYDYIMGIDSIIDGKLTSFMKKAPILMNFKSIFGILSPLY